MSNASDQQPLVPPVLRRFQAVKEQQTVHLKHKAPGLCSKSDDCLTPSCSNRSKLFRRHPKSTVHGVVHQFWQLHEQKSGIDRLLSSVGSIFRRMCTQDARRLRLLDNGENAGIHPDENSLSSQESSPRMKGDWNCVDKTDTEKDDLPAVVVASFEETTPRRKIQNGTNSKSRDIRKSKYRDGVVSGCGEDRTPEFLVEVVPKSNHGETAKYHDGANFHEESKSKSHEETTSNSHGHKHRKTRSALSKKQLEIGKHADKQSTTVVENLNSSGENAANAKVIGATPERSKLTQLLHYRHRKLNFSKAFRIKRKCGQKYSLPPHLPLAAEPDQTDALPCDPELDNNKLELSFASNEAMARKSRRLPSLQRSSSCANNTSNRSQNNLTLRDRTGCQEKGMANKIKELAGFRRSSVHGNLTVDAIEQGQVGRKSKTTATQESVHRFHRDLNQETREHLTDSTDELTLLIQAAF
ncbi:hypothetical protein BsWGS_10772 [Bradybaena similaris]